MATAAPTEGEGEAHRFQDFHDNVKEIIQAIVSEKLSGQAFDTALVAQWTAQISEACLHGCRKLEKPFKFVANCTILQRVGAGLHTSSSCLWNSKSDGSCTVRWESDQLYCIVIVYGLAL